MGSPTVPELELGCYKNGSHDYRKRETPHLVTFTNDFFMAVFQTTQGQYAKITTNPSSFKNYEDSPFRPAENMTYNSLRGDGWPESGHVVAEGSFLALVRNRTGLEVDLPTDAQWEFACRAGSTRALNNDKNLTSETTCANLDEVAWYNGNSGGTTHPVGLKKPNAWGLYDMHGNVWDWCLDWMGVSYGPAMSDKPVVEPVGYTTAERPTQNGKLEIQRCRRGATYSHDAKICRSAWRGSDQPTAAFANTGFRMICPVGGTW
jgi:formylglycine-generating enzyme required for sulfatase activity